MRVVREGDSLEEALTSAKSEALSAFGNGAVFLERLVAFTSPLLRKILRGLIIVLYIQISCSS